MRVYFILLLSIINVFGFSQSNTTESTEVAPNITETSITNNNNGVVGVIPAGILPRGFDALDLGKSSEMVINILKEKNMFLYIEKEFGTLSKYDKRILSVKGSGFVDNAYFYFSKDDTLVSLVLFLRSDYIDYATLFTNFVEKYGRPSMTPDEASWTDTEISIHLEKPLSIKYVLEKEIPDAKSLSKKPFIDLNREKFLEYF